jgi:aromatic ring-opening dioxygenase catalytic subunit (LigB family)
VLIVGSGMPFHDMRGFGDPRAYPISEQFDAWLREAAVQEPAERDARLVEWAKAPAARRSHPREEHLLPLMVVAGAAGSDRGSIPYSGRYMGVQVSAVQFGA